MVTDRLVFGPKERRAANDAQVMTFFRGYDSSWRLSKLLLIRAMLRDRDRLQKELQKEYVGAARADDQYVYGPMTNGLLFSAVTELTMLIEDLFALLKFIRSRERFANLITHYKAGVVTNAVGILKSASPDRLLSAFMIPPLEIVGAASTDLTTNYQAGASLLVRLVRKAADLYERYSFHYSKYKHGLTVALRPFGGGALPPEALARRRDGLTGTLFCYDARGVDKVKGKSSPVLSFMLEPEIQPFLNELHASDNLLRFHGEPRETSIEDLVAHAYDMTRLIDVLEHNRVDLILPQEDATQSRFWLPLEEEGRPRGLLQFSVERTTRWTLESFREEL